MYFLLKYATKSKKSGHFGDIRSSLKYREQYVMPVFGMFLLSMINSKSKPCSSCWFKEWLSLIYILYSLY